tara:strand:- start:243 stop:359 length:117 start_codon:yes stop_codon:yes gene_type:complete
MKEFYIKIHLPGIEPGPLAWKARILTIGPQMIINKKNI